ncbi:MAG: hypothetical protein MUF54_09350 [Polyangiaceae bacterium]|jgi:hypothetical protein|nr:hypothetical protein [Polyangiaceae bacterium]
MAHSGIGVTKELLTWLETLAQRGAFVAAPDGSGGVVPKVDELIRAIHIVLAGGEVEAKIKFPGERAISQDLDRKLDATLRAASVSATTVSNVAP